MADKNTNLAKINSNLDVIRSSVYKFNIHNLENSYTVADFNTYNTYEKKEENKIKKFKRVTCNNNIGAIRIKSWVYDEKEDIVERFKNIYNSFMNSGESIAMVIKRLCTGAEFYFVFKNDSMYSGGGHKAAEEGINKLEATIKGNFPGTVTEKFHDDPSDIAGLNDKKVVSVITNIASEKSEKFKSQGIEKLLNGIVPEKEENEYTIVILAESISYEALMDIRNGYEEIASNVSEFKEWQVTETKGKSENWGDGSSLTNTHGTNSSIARTNGFSIGSNYTSGNSISTPIGGTTGMGWARAFIKTLINPIKKDIVKTKSKQGSIGLSAGFQHSKTKVEGESNSKSIGYSSNHCIGTENSTGETRTYTSYPVKNLMERIDEHIKKLNECEAVGAWREASYIFAHNSLTANKVAGYYMGLMQGDESYTEAAVINTWADTGDNASKENTFRHIRDFVSHFTHPVFFNTDDVNRFDEKDKDKVELTDIECITPTTYVSSIDLASMMAFPYSSVAGLTCMKCAAFERNIYEKDNLTKENNKKLNLGSIYHMHKEENTEVYLNADSLTRHTFITGSTGSGKSTTIYKILREANNKGIPFLVVEPAKGEYRKEFGDIGNIKTYSTNYRDAELLKINPFSFPADKILVNEHIDRLVEIFNACWPMYAAMPAVLKDAMEKAYEAAGWDLVLSENRYGNIFPDFQELLNQLHIVMDSSDYSDENKSNYKGALVTRVRSLTNGINGVVFSNKEIDFNEIIKAPTIIDLSKVGSAETKALIMGVIVMKIQENYFGQNGEKELKHITVLEEAHNLLKRTSDEQNTEGSNLIGKSVEMISNAIAEMRTYGEGFIIADQSPGKLDLSVIRNTNTKIIMSLPDYSDRELVGKSVNLSDEQIDEIPRLGQGVGVIYQNEWISPVLCKVKMAEKKADTPNDNTNMSNYRDKLINEMGDIKRTSADIVLALLRNNYEKIDELETEKIMNLHIPINYKLMLETYKINKAELTINQKGKLIYKLCFNDKMGEILADIENNKEKLKIKSENTSFYKKWQDALYTNIEKTDETDSLSPAILAIIISNLVSLDNKRLENCEQFFYNIKGGWH